MSGGHVIVEKKANCTWVTINHPERRNSFDYETLAALTEAIETAGRDRENAAIVLTGAGDDAFCAGGYLKDLTHFDAEQGRLLYGQTIKCLDAIRRTPMPVIAAVNGWAMGGGNELVIAADLAIAVESAHFGQTGPRIGSSPVFGGTNLLAISIGEKRAKEACMLCKPFTAAEALSLGWINKVVPDGELAAEVASWVFELSQRSPAYIELTKVSSNMWWDMLTPYFHHGQQILLQLAGGPEMTEGANAFMEKRKPDFDQFRKKR